MHKIKKHVKYLVAVILILLAAVGAAYAAFADKGSILGSKFTVGSSDIKLLVDVRNGTVSENLAEELQGPDFSNISPNWSHDYLIKIYNNGTTDVHVTSNANYTTANDPDELRSVIYVEPLVWEDTNSNGILEEGEVGESFGKKTIIKWKTEGYDLGTLQQGLVKSIVLRFSTADLSETKQGKSGVFDFEFDSISL